MDLHRVLLASLESSVADGFGILKDFVIESSHAEPRLIRKTVCNHFCQIVIIG
jgi:hypothetical protein